MKALQQLFITLIFLIGCIGFSQTPEQQKMIDKALKMRDSIMHCITLEEMLQQANAQEERHESANKTNKSEPSSIPKTTKNEDKYWKNTLASDNDSKLKNWNYGEANLVFNYYYDSRKDKVEYVKVGAN